MLNNSFCGVGLAFKASIGGKYLKVVTCIIMLHYVFEELPLYKSLAATGSVELQGFCGLEIRLLTLSVLKQAIQTHISNIQLYVTQTMYRLSMENLKCQEMAWLFLQTRGKAESLLNKCV